MKRTLSLILTLTTSSLLQAVNKEPEEANVLGALDVVTETAQRVNEADVINFLTNIYGDHGYYDSGGWDDDNQIMPYDPNLSLPAWIRGEFVRPTDGSITSHYGFRPKFGRMHRGVDLAICAGDTIVSALPGVVDRIGYDMWGYGHYVVIRHDGNVETRYGHLQKAIAIKGQKVKAGDPVAIGGNSGNSTGPHLHFETRYKGQPLDPISLF